MGTVTGRVYCAVSEHPVSLEQPCGKRALSRHTERFILCPGITSAPQGGATRPVKNPPRYLCFDISADRRLDPATCEEPVMVSWPAGAVLSCTGGTVVLRVDAERLGKEPGRSFGKAQPTQTREWWTNPGLPPSTLSGGAPSCALRRPRLLAGHVDRPPCPFERVEPLTPRAWFAQLPASAGGPRPRA